MWLYVPDESENAEPWIGQLNLNNQMRKTGSFELIRHVDINNLYHNPFQSKDVIVGLLDHQRLGTLLKPIVTKIDPGVLEGYARTRLEGLFHGLVSGLGIDDPKLAQFRGLSFSSAAFRSWYGGGEHSFVSSKQATTITVPEPVRREFPIDGSATLNAQPGQRCRGRYGRRELNRMLYSP